MRRISAVLIVTALLPGVAWAQDEMTFEAEELPAEGEEGAESDEMTFETDEGGTPRAVSLVIASPGADPALAQTLSDALSVFVRSQNSYELVPSEDFRAMLFAPGESAAMDCVTNAVCLSGYGKELWLDTIVLGVLYRGEGGWKVQIDKIGVERAEVEAYVSEDDDSLGSRSIGAVEELARKLGRKLFGIRQSDTGEEKLGRKLVPMRGSVQTTLAWATAGLAVVALGASVSFGVAASSLQSDLESREDLTQVEAKDLIRQGESRAVSANVFMALAAVAGLGSAALFLIKPLQEVDVDQQGPTPGFGSEEGGASIVPVLMPDGVGVSATWRLP